MDTEFVRYLAGKGISQASYETGTLADQSKLVDSFERSKVPAAPGLVLERRRSFSEEYISQVIGSVVETGIKALSHQSVSKTCFLVGAYNTSSLHCNVWVTARHGNETTGSELQKDQEVSIHLSKKRTLHKCRCIYVNIDSDIALIASALETDIPDILSFGHIRGTLQEVFIAGYGNTVSADEVSIISCHVSRTDATYSGRGDVLAQRRTNRFFMVDKVTDYGFSGGPVLNSVGRVVGMVCAGSYEGASWILKPEFIVDAVEDVLNG